MFRKTMIALVATAALAGVALAPTVALAKHGGGGFYGGHGFHGGYGYRGFGIAVVDRSASCWQNRWVETRRGLRRILVNVCDF
jgi:hypothetical protein